MPLDLMTLPTKEAERLAYAEGFTGTATLFGRLADAERVAEEVETLREERDDLERELSNLRESLRDLLGE